MVLERVGDDLINKGIQVMMPWEKEYMEFCIKKLNPTGKVLEIGFGLGYSATAICSRPGITDYTVIECAPIIWDAIEKFKNKFPNIKINLIKGRWEDVMYTAGIHDYAFFDPLNWDGKVMWATFIEECVKYNLKIGSVIGMYSGDSRLSNLPFVTETSHTFDVQIPPECKYAKGDKMYAKLFEVIEEWRVLPPKPVTKPTFGKLLSNISISAYSRSHNKTIFKIFDNICEDDMQVIAPIAPVNCEINNILNISKRMHIWFTEKCTIRIFDKYLLNIDENILIMIMPGKLELIQPQKVNVKIYLI